MSKEIVFFIDNEQFKTESTEVLVRTLLTDFAKENPAETILVEKHGNELTEHTDINESITLRNGMHFIVYNNRPTIVSMR